MGGVFDKLTHSAVVSPDGTIQWNASPAAGAKNLAAAQAKELSPSTSSISDSGDVSMNSPGTQYSRQVKPSLAQAATGPNGMPNAGSPALTKMGKLAVLLTQGAQGALAGRAAQEQTVAATGGRRSGGIGTAFQAGYQLPFTRAMMPLQLQQQQAETSLAQAGTQPIQTPYGQMPTALASKILSPYLGAQGRVQAARVGAEGKVQSEGIAKRYIAVPNVGLYDTQSRELLPDTQQGITVTPEIAQDYGLPDQFVGKPMNIQQLASVERAQNGQEVTVQGQSGPALVNKKTKQRTDLGLGNPGMGRPVQVGDTNNPGETKFMTGADAVRSGAPGPESASVQTAKRAAASEVPTKIGDQKVAFTTMIQHAQLLRDAARALNNGDQQTLAGLKNKFKNEFGYAGPITASAIADAYKGEVSNVINKGHITDTGNEKIAHTLDPSKQNFQTVDAVLGAYQSLAQSKMNMLNQQEQGAIQRSQPKKRTGAPASRPASNDPLGIR